MFHPERFILRDLNAISCVVLINSLTVEGRISLLVLIVWKLIIVFIVKKHLLIGFFSQSDKLNQMIAEKKAALAPIIKELRPLRAKCNELEHLHTQ